STATWVVAQAADEPMITVTSAAAAELGGETTVSLPLSVLTPPSGPLDYAEARRLFLRDRARAWAAYAAGALGVLHHVYGRTAPSGAKLFVHSDVPVSRGIASSAALEVASLVALTALVSIALDGRQVGLLAQKVENLVVGALGGVMDQVTAASGRRDHL